MDLFLVFFFKFGFWLLEGIQLFALSKLTWNSCSMSSAVFPTWNRPPHIGHDAGLGERVVF